MMRFRDLFRSKAKEPDRATQVRGFLSNQANKHLQSPDFRGASKFIQVFGSALAESVPAHVAGLVWSPPIIGATGKESALILDQWQNADDAHMQDLAALLAWYQSRASFVDVKEIFPEAQWDAGFRNLMVLSGNLFETSERAISLCKRYQECLNGEYRRLGGGLLDEGGTYLVMPDAPEITTHLWMINETLAGPALSMTTGMLDTASIAYLQLMTIRVTIAITDGYRKHARELLQSVQ